MRTIGKIESDMEELRSQLHDLEIEKKLAEKDAARPRERRIRDRYEAVASIIRDLNTMGERIGDAEGYALHIKGKSFEIHPETGVQEI
jgi:hypothetical protein